MEKKAEDTERVENKVENELKIKCQKRERTDKKENPREKKKKNNICLIYVKKSSPTNEVKLKQNK